MLEDIRDAFEDAVHGLEWMDETTRERTLTKLHAIRAFVGYPGWIMNATQLDIHYREVSHRMTMAKWFKADGRTDVCSRRRWLHSLAAGGTRA